MPRSYFTKQGTPARWLGVGVLCLVLCGCKGQDAASETGEGSTTGKKDTGKTAPLPYGPKANQPGK